MRRQIHLIITAEQRAAAEALAAEREPTSWPAIAREALTAGLAAMKPQRTPRPHKGTKP